MRNLLYLILVAAVCSCTSVNKEQVNLINGYWNIDKVTMQDGAEREFPFSNHMDYFIIDGTSGSKHRVSPRYDGTYVDYGSPIRFTFKEEDNQIILVFKEDIGSYEQVLEYIDDESMTLRHENGTLYEYLKHDDEK